MLVHYTLGYIASELGLELRGEPDCKVKRVATLTGADTESISFMADARYRKHLSDCRAAALIIQPAELEHWQGNALLSDNPYLAYARLTALFAPASGNVESMIDPSANIHSTAVLGERVRIGANAVIGASCRIGDGAEIGPGCVLGADVSIGKAARLYPNVTIYHDCHVGERTTLHSGSVIGSDGFGFANDQGRWVKIHQLGRVIIGHDVEIGANTTVDRGAIEDTVIGDNVIIDNLVQVAHNVRIGDHCAIAGCVGIAGSAEIGKHCAFGGGAGILGHLNITDGVTVTAMSLVTNSVKTPGVYSAGTPLEPKTQWQKNYVRFKQLDDMARRLKALEKQIQKLTEEG